MSRRASKEAADAGLGLAVKSRDCSTKCQKHTETAHGPSLPLWSLDISIETGKRSEGGSPETPHTPINPSLKGIYSDITCIRLINYYLQLPIG